MNRAPPAVGERGAPWGAAVAVALPVLLYRYPPMFDLPNHVEVVAAMRHFSDPARYPPGLLAWNLGHPNQLFYFVALAVSVLFAANTACKVVIAASVAAIPLAAARLADHLGATRWAAVAVAPFGLGFVFLYEAQESVLVAGALALVVLSAARPLTLRASIYRATPLLGTALVLLLEQLRALRAMGPSRRDLTSPIPPVVIAPEHRWEGAMQRAAGGGGDLRPGFDLARFRYVLAFVPEGETGRLARALARDARAHRALRRPGPSSRPLFRGRPSSRPSRRSRRRWSRWDTASNESTNATSKGRRTEASCKLSKEPRPEAKGASSDQLHPPLSPCLA